jgi:uncharacterized protein (DUF983 family)
MTSTLLKVCPNCESRRVSWFTHAGTLAIGCDECSETLHIADLDDIASRLNGLDYPRN